MADDAIVFAMANPDPEVRPEDIMGDVRVIATGRSDYPNQINNVLAFPGIFRGALAAQATSINDQMNLAAARAIAAVISEDELFEEYVIPSVFNKAVVEVVAHAVHEAAIETGVAQRTTRPSTDPSRRSTGRTRRGGPARLGARDFAEEGWGRRFDGVRVVCGAGRVALGRRWGARSPVGLTRFGGLLSLGVLPLERSLDAASTSTGVSGRGDSLGS